MARRIGRVWRLPRSLAGRVLVIVLVLAAAGGLGVGAALATPVLLDRFAGEEPAPVPTDPPPDPLTPVLGLHAVDGSAPAPTPAGVSAVLERPAGSPELGALSGQVVDPVAGTQLWAREPTGQFVPGSTAKLVTAAAALLALDHDARLETTVVAGDVPGTVVLVGGGDPTLSALPAGKESVYPGAARLDDLVAQVRAAVPAGVSRVLVDVDRYTGDALGPGWLPADVPAGYVAPIVPVMLDGGRAEPTETTAARSGTPALTAATELARRLGAPPQAAVGRAAPNAAVLATVRSPTIGELVATMLSTSDNVLAEAIAREVAVARGVEPSFAGSIQAIRSVLTASGIDVAGLETVDGSGLSARSRVTAAGLTALLVAAATPGVADERGAKLRPMVNALPVAGGSGTLAGRYLDGSSVPGRGYVRAKTGTLDNVNSLAGIVVDADGRLLVFAFLSNGSSASTARPALDAIAAALRTCGCR